MANKKRKFCRRQERRRLLVSCGKVCENGNVHSVQNSLSNKDFGTQDVPAAEI